ncbi:MAG: MATE family efflux transporter [Bacteroidetes bacterium]|nr:MATE family efflux transporter [Bacteroidota bacterium]
MKNLTSGSETRVIAAFVLPLIAGSIIQQLFQTVDSIIVGRFLGESALASVGVSNPIILMIVSLLIGIGAGADILTARYFGAEDYRGLKKVIDSYLIAVLVAAVLVGIAGFFLAEPILRLIRTPDEIVTDAKAYLRVIFLGMFFLAGYNTFSGILRGTGNSKTPFYFLLVAVFLNVGLDLLFVVVFEMGIAGAAYATVTAQGTAFFACLLYINRYNPLVSFHFRHLELSMKYLRKGIAIGTPEAFQRIITAVGRIVIQAMINPFGTTVIAAYTAGMRIDSFAGLPIMELAHAMTLFTSQNYGAGEIERIKQGKKAALKIGWTCSLVLMIFMWMFGDHMIFLFNTNPEVIRMGHQYIKIASTAYFFASFMYINLGIIKGLGNTFVPMIISLVILWFVRIPAAWVMGKQYGIFGIWISIPISWATGAVVVIWVSRIFYRRAKDRIASRRVL